MDNTTPIPSWACSQYGDYEHDYMNCLECFGGYIDHLDIDAFDEDRDKGDKR